MYQKIELNENNDNKYLVVETVFGEKTIKLNNKDTKVSPKHPFRYWNNILLF